MSWLRQHVVLVKVSIVILSYHKPLIIDVCLRSLAITEGVEYEVIVVDNESTPHTAVSLQQHKDEGRIDTLILEPTNLMFSGGNNVGVAAADPSSEFIVLVNSDVGFLRGDWLSKQLAWMEGTIEHRPTIWNAHPTQPSPGPKDIISFGWSHDTNIEGNARPEGWCIMFRREWWAEMSTDFPWLYGFEEMVAKQVRAGARCGVCFNYTLYVVHREGGSKPDTAPDIVNRRFPDLTAWFSEIKIETLDFTLGPNEHDSYLEW